MGIISTDISKAIEILNNGELVAIPTETVYGLAGNIFNESSVKRIFETKKRPAYNPLIVHIPSIEYLNKVVSYIPEKAKQLADAFWPGSLTLILPKKSSIPDLVTAGKSTVGVRIPNHPVTLELLKRLEFPLAAPSANPFNRISPTRPEHVADYFEDSLEMVLDGGVCQKGVESTIIGFENDNPVVYRLGAISIEEIEAVVGPVELKNKKERNPDAPGMLLKHYSPRTKIMISDSIVTDHEVYKSEKIGVLSFSNSYNQSLVKVNSILSPSGNLEEAAANLYQSLHELDSQNLTIILAEKFPEEGLGKTINDRLQRAAS